MSSNVMRARYRIYLTSGDVDHYALADALALEAQTRGVSGSVGRQGEALPFVVAGSQEKVLDLIGWLRDEGRPWAGRIQVRKEQDLEYKEDGTFRNNVGAPRERQASKGLFERARQLFRG